MSDYLNFFILLCMEKAKLYYTMGEVADMFDVNISTIRYWDKQFSILKPERNKKGNRLFRPQDIDAVRLIYHLVKEKGMTISGATLYLENHKLSSHDKDMDVIERLEGVKSLLTEVMLQFKEDKDGSRVIYENEND